MSGKGGSLTAVGADGYYIPPEYDARIHGSLDKYQSEAGTAGGKWGGRIKHTGGTSNLIIRFEMPFNVWCVSCGRSIAKGVRFNAEKKQAGTYYNTKLWSFSFRLPCCQSRCEIQTDPKNADYAIVRGARRKVEEYSAKDAGVQELIDEEHRERLRTDATYRVEHHESARQLRTENDRQLQLLRRESDLLHADEHGLNRQLRRQMRGARHDHLSRVARGEEINLDPRVKLLPEHPEDIEIARLQSDIGFGQDEADAQLHMMSEHGPREADRKQKAVRKQIMSSSIFSRRSTSRVTSVTKGVSTGAVTKGHRNERRDRKKFAEVAPGYDKVRAALRRSLGT